MVKVVVTKHVSFDAAHYLPNYVGKCSNLHGHHWVVEVSVTGEVDPQSGMVLDFSLLKSGLQPLLENLDHHLVNKIVYNPTAENLAVYIHDWLKIYWNEPVQLHSIKVWEGPDSCAEVIV